MTSLPVKNIGAVMTGTTASGTGKTSQSANSVSFESVWNNQTEKNNASNVETENPKTVRKEEGTIARDSLKSKETRQESVNNEPDAPRDEFKEMDPKEWEEAMEVLGAAAVQMVEQIADTFGMTTEEVQELMTDLGMEQMDVLQQENLSQLILAAGGAQDATSLLTNEELYQQYQTLMEQLNTVLEESGETLQMDPEQLVQMVAETVDDNLQNPVTVEITVDEDAVVDQGTESPETENVTDDTVTDVTVKNVNNQNTEEQPDGKMQGQDGRQNESAQVATDKGMGENVVLQNLKTESFEPQLQQLSEQISAWDADTMDIMNQIMDYMKIQVKADVSNLEMQLHPESLGTLQIHVAAKDGAVTAQFITQNETVKAALESQMIQLKENFAQQGVKVDAIEVTVQTHQFEQNLEQGRGRGQDEPDRRSRTRRIQLDGNFTMDDLSGMEEEEQLAAQMMAANGNTVDYTA